MFQDETQKQRIDLKMQEMQHERQAENLDKQVEKALETGNMKEAMLKGRMKLTREHRRQQSTKQREHLERLQEKTQEFQSMRNMAQNIDVVNHIMQQVQKEETPTWFNDRLQYFQHNMKEMDKRTDTMTRSMDAVIQDDDTNKYENNHESNYREDVNLNQYLQSKQRLLNKQQQKQLKQQQRSRSTSPAPTVIDERDMTDRFQRLMGNEEEHAVLQVCIPPPPKT